MLYIEMGNVRNRIDVKLVSNRKKKKKKKKMQNGHPNQVMCHTKYLTVI